MHLFIAFFSDFIYAISRPDKEGYPQHDLSEDNDIVLDANVVEWFKSKQLAIERIITKIFVTYHIDVVITDCIQAHLVLNYGEWVTKYNLWGGGKSRENLLTKWKSTRWKLELRDSEIASKEHVIAATSTKRCKLLQESLNHSKKQLEDTSKQLKDTSNQLRLLKKSTLRLSNTLRSGIPSSRRKRKSWLDCTAQYQNQQKKRVKLDVQTALTFTVTENFHAIKVQMMNKDTKEVLDIECGKAVGTSDKSKVEKALLVKERFNISDVAYHQLAQINPKLPRQSQLTKVSKGMNTAYNIWPTPGQTEGVQQSIVDRLKIRLQHILKKNPSFALRKSIRVKITGDGTVVSRSLHLLVVAFSIVDVNEENPNAPSGNHIVALLNTTEDYDNMAETMENVVQDIKS